MKAQRYSICLMVFLLFTVQIMRGSEEAGTRGSASNDTVDIGFYHLDLHISDSSTYLYGKVSLHLTLLQEPVSSVSLDMGFHLHGRIAKQHPSRRRVGENLGRTARNHVIADEDVVVGALARSAIRRAVC